MSTGTLSLWGTKQFLHGQYRSNVNWQSQLDPRSLNFDGRGLSFEDRESRNREYSNSKRLMSKQFIPQRKNKSCSYVMCTCSSISHQPSSTAYALIDKIHKWFDAFLYTCNIQEKGQWQGEFQARLFSPEKHRYPISKT